MVGLKKFSQIQLAQLYADDLHRPLSYARVRVLEEWREMATVDIEDVYTKIVLAQRGHRHGGTR